MIVDRMNLIEFRYRLTSLFGIVVLCLPFAASAKNLANASDALVNEQRPNILLIVSEDNPRRVLKYDVVNNRWSHIGQMRIGAIVTSAVKWNGQVVIPSGEVKPGIRTPRVQALPVGKE